METYASKEAVAFAMWRVIRDTSGQREARELDGDFALFARCLEAVENKKPMRVSQDAVSG